MTHPSPSTLAAASPRVADGLRRLLREAASKGESPPARRLLDLLDAALDEAEWAGTRRLARTIPHELAQPLSEIRGYAELLADQRGRRSDRAELLEHIMEAAERLGTLIHAVGALAEGTNLPRKSETLPAFDLLTLEKAPGAGQHPDPAQAPPPRLSGAARGPELPAGGFSRGASQRGLELVRAFAPAVARGTGRMTGADVSLGAVRLDYRTLACDLGANVAAITSARERSGETALMAALVMPVGMARAVSERLKGEGAQDESGASQPLDDLSRRLLEDCLDGLAREACLDVSGGEVGRYTASPVLLLDGGGQGGSVTVSTHGWPRYVVLFGTTSGVAELHLAVSPGT